MLFAGRDGRLEYTFVAHPGASVKDIGLAYDGADALSIDAGGNLRIDTPAGVLTDTRPDTYQIVRGSRVGVQSHFVLRSKTTFGLAVGARQHAQPDFRSGDRIVLKRARPDVFRRGAAVQLSRAASDRRFPVGGHR